MHACGMKTDHCDILVVGAGPAGACAAAEAARRKLRVLIVERKSEIGRPVQCAEYIPAPLVGELNLGRQFAAQRVQGMITHLADRPIKKTSTPGFIIHRDIFDQTLVKSACDGGARILLSAKAISRNGNEVVVKTKNGSFITVIAKVIIGADGPLSTVGKWIGCVNQNLIAAAQVRVPLTHRLESAEIYFDSDCYGGYAWLFPKDKIANLGLGMKKKNNAPLPLRHLLDRFISHRVGEGKITQDYSGLITGWIPAGPLPRIVHENIALVGDAAGQTHPITGAGIFSAVTCGRLAGKWAARTIARQDPEVLHEYEKECVDLFGDMLQRAAARRQLMEQNWHQLDKILKFCWIAFKEYYARTE